MIKKISIFMLITLFPLMIFAYPKGDIDGNGKVEVRDYLILRRYFIKTRELTNDELTRADVNNDGKVNPVDYNTIMRILIKIDNPSNNDDNTIVAVENVKLTKDSLVLEPGDTTDLSYIVNPNNATNKKVIWESSNENVVKVDANGKITALSTGKATISITAEDGKKEDRCSVNVYDKEYYAEVNVLNMYNTPEILESLKDNEKYKDGYEYGQVIIIKSRDNKYILIDTGMKNDVVVDSIYKKLKEYQKTDNVNIDYMIITHSHNDHIGNALNLLNKKVILINKTIMKRESKSAKPYDNIAKKMGKDNMVEITQEGQKIIVGDYLEIYLFNTSDIYKDKECHNGCSIYYVGNKEYANMIKDQEGSEYYYYFNGSDYPNITLKRAKNPTRKYNKSNGINNIFYASVSKSDDCNANTNSLGVLIKVKGKNGNNYMYFSGDIDNGGYEIFPSNGIHGSGSGALYPINDDGTCTIPYNKETGLFDSTKQISNLNRVPSETNVANNIKKTIGNDIKNIKIYQSAHHGLNDALDAINILNLNRSDVWTIITRAYDISTNSQFLFNRTYYYTLDKTSKLYPGGKTKNGIYCTINNKGNTLCNYY